MRNGSSLGPLDVYVSPRDDSGKLVWDLGTANPPNHGKETLVFEKDTPGRDIVFHILDGDFPGIQYDTADPFWAQQGKKCPPKPHGKDDQLDVLDVQPRDLTVHDKNKGNPCNLVYQLNFANGVEACDPIIENRGGIGGGG